MKRHAPGAPIILVGTKLDMRPGAPKCLEELRSKGQAPISPMQGAQMQREIGAVRYIECSALTQEGLALVFEEAIRAALRPAVKPAKTLDSAFQNIHQTEPIRMEGYMHKRGERLGLWRKRFFVLRGAELQYGEDSRSAQSPSARRGSFTLVDSKCSATFEAPGGSGAGRFYIGINLPDGTQKIHLYVATEDDRLAWFEALHAAGTGAGRV